MGAGPRLRLGLVALVLAGAAMGPPSASVADESAAPPKPWYDEVTINGFLAASYSYNFNRPRSMTNQFRVFDFDDNSIKLDEFELVVQRPVAKPRESGFRVDVTFGSSVPRVTAAAGLFRDETGRAEDLDVHQAFGSWIAPVGSGLRLDFGKFVTPLGYEVVDGYDGWNDSATRSFLFGYAIPFTHVGVRGTYSPSHRVTGMLMLVNGWDVARDNNRAKTVGGQVAVRPFAPLTLTVSEIYGAERTGDDGDPRSVVDVVAVWKANERLTLGANGDWGAEKIGAENTHWNGVAGYVSAVVAGPFTIAVRSEHFEDLQGARTGLRQKLDEVTVTPALRLSAHTVVRADLRADTSDRHPFEKRSTATTTQTTFLVSVLSSF